MSCLSAQFFGSQSKEPLHTMKMEQTISLSSMVANFQKDVNEYLTSVIEKTGKQPTVTSIFPHYSLISAALFT